MDFPDCPFYLFGMGDRRKLLYRRGELLDALTREVLRRWDAAAEEIAPGEYTVAVRRADGGTAVLSEDGHGVWLDEDGARRPLAEGRLALPGFDDHPHAALLRALYHDLLVCIVDGAPVPNPLVYPRPWYRDAAMMCLRLERLGNLHLVRDWILGLTEPFDENNRCREPDNLGQALYLISLVSDASHPLVETILRTVPQYQRGRHIVGPTDGAEHPVYQTKWLKYGLRRLGLIDPYEVPSVFDSYSALFWMDFRGAHVEGPGFDETAKDYYPYLAWAEAHFHGWPPPAGFAKHAWPLTWEAHASQADYPRMAAISPQYVERCLCTPHSWHAAEMLLYLLDRP